MKYKIEASWLLFFRTGAELLRFALLVFLNYYYFAVCIWVCGNKHIFLYIIRKLNLNENISPLQVLMWGARRE